MHVIYASTVFLQRSWSSCMHTSIILHIAYTHSNFGLTSICATDSCYQISYIRTHTTTRTHMIGSFQSPMPYCKYIEHTVCVYIRWYENKVHYPHTSIFCSKQCLPDVRSKSTSHGGRGALNQTTASNTMRHALCTLSTLEPLSAILKCTSDLVWKLCLLSNASRALQQWHLHQQQNYPI